MKLSVLSLYYLNKRKCNNIAQHVVLKSHNSRAPGLILSLGFCLCGDSRYVCWFLTS